MPATALSICRWVAAEVGVDSSFSSFSTLDESADILRYVNNALRHLTNALPADVVPLFRNTFQVLTSSGTVSYTISDATFNRVPGWGVTLRTDQNTEKPLKQITPEAALQQFPQTTTPRGEPEYYQITATGVRFYPTPDDAYRITLRYSKPHPALANPSDTFLYPDEWVEGFVAHWAKMLYEIDKGFQTASATADLAKTYMAGIQVDVSRLSPQYVRGTEVF